MHHERLANSDHTLLGSGNRTLEQEEVILDDTVVWEASQGRDSLWGNVRLCRRILLVVTAANTVDLLVQFSTMVITV